ncbi:MAG TPA: ABC transporter ATP-binding protein [Mycobacteriales bacterium]|nr:ABC transporter ATP-binding protein [Mycobacteriales bacterium]
MAVQLNATAHPGRERESDLLRVTDLRVSFSTPDGVLQAVRGISFAVRRGQTLGIVGESGAGKSVSTQAILRLVAGARVSGRAVFDGQDLLTASEVELRAVRGARIGVIFQDPLSNLHPFYRVGWQIAEAIRTHTHTGRRAAHRRAVELLDLVGIPQPDRRVNDFPHQFSGGMRQRAMIAMALSCNPALLVADEPTTALDVTVQAQIIELIRRLQAEFHTAVIMITHDLGLLADLADDIVVMYAGRAVEVAPRRTLYYTPHHPYTRGLLDSLPARASRRGRLRPIPGQPPSLLSLPAGCPFHPRCAHAMDRCRTDPPELESLTGADHQSACWLPTDWVADGSASAGPAGPGSAGAAGSPGPADPTGTAGSAGSAWVARSATGGAP